MKALMRDAMLDGAFGLSTGLFYVPAWENTSTTYIKGDTPPEFKPGGGFTGLFPRPGLACNHHP